jgi:predicted flap endonuclease-1-like 5' DNA nuclease
MPHYFIELAIWMLLFYFVGCLFGWALRNVFGHQASEPAVVAAVAPQAAEPAPVQAPKPAPAAAAASPIPTGKMERPKGIAAARGGKADNLQRISGVGPKNEAILHNLGVFHFDQIAAWTPEQITWVDDHLRFNGRILREEWIRQAGLLAAGKEEEFTREFGTGGLKDKKGETQSGTRTRKS